MKVSIRNRDIQLIRFLDLVIYCRTLKCETDYLYVLIFGQFPIL